MVEKEKLTKVTEEKLKNETEKNMLNAGVRSEQKRPWRRITNTAVMLLRR